MALALASVNGPETGNIDKSIKYYEVKDDEGKPLLFLVRQGDTSFTVYSSDERNSHRLVTKAMAREEVVRDFFRRSGVAAPSKDDEGGKKLSAFLDGLAK